MTAPTPQEPTNDDQVAPGQGPRTSSPARRTFSAGSIRAIVTEYDGAPVDSKGAVLRRARLWDSDIREWRDAIDSGTLDKPAARRGSPKKTAEQVQLDRLTKALATERAAHERTRGRLASSDAARATLETGVAFLEDLSSKNPPPAAPDASGGTSRP